MTPVSAGHPHSCGVYEIRIQGHLGPRWAGWFDEMTLTSQHDGTTLLHGRVVDQAALHGLLRKLRDTGLPLVSVSQVTPDPLHAPPPNPVHEGD